MLMKKPTNTTMYRVWSETYTVNRQSNFEYITWLGSWSLVRWWTSSACRYACNYSNNYCDLPLNWDITSCAKTYTTQCQWWNAPYNSVITNCEDTVYCNQWSWWSVPTCNWKCDSANGYFDDGKWGCYFDICKYWITDNSISHWGYCCEDADCSPSAHDKWDDGTPIQKSCVSHMCVECTKDSDCRDGRKCAPNGECRTDDGGSVSALPKPSTPSAPINWPARCEDGMTYDITIPNRYDCGWSHPSTSVIWMWNSTSETSGKSWSYQSGTSQLWDCRWRCKEWYHPINNYTNCEEDIYSCTWTWPWEHTTSSTATPKGGDKAWSYKETGELWACEWRCESSNYERDWTTTNCKEKIYSCTWTVPWTNTTSSTTAPNDGNKMWTYKATWDLWPCEWRCKSSDYVRDWTSMNCKAKTYSCTWTAPWTHTTSSTSAPTGWDKAWSIQVNMNIMSMSGDVRKLI